MSEMPFQRLSNARRLERADLPPDLAAFYERNEGLGLESDPDILVRMCRIEEVERIGWADLHVIGSDHVPGWETFSAIRIAMSAYFDEIVYVLDCPCCDAGSILCLGVDVSGPGGAGETPLEVSLVLAASFGEWLARLERFQWVEYGLMPGSIDELPPSAQVELRGHFTRLNPEISWGAMA